jgi:hypothetical protein
MYTITHKHPKVYYYKIKGQNHLTITKIDGIMNFMSYILIFFQTNFIIATNYP